MALVSPCVLECSEDILEMLGSLHAVPSAFPACGGVIRHRPNPNLGQIDPVRPTGRRGVGLSIELVSQPRELQVVVVDVSRGGRSGDRVRIRSPHYMRKEA